MSLPTDYRNAIAAIVEAATGIKLVPGYFDGPAQNGDIGCIYPAGVREDSSNITRQIMEVRVRLFKNISGQNPGSDVAGITPPMDPTVLEDLIETCQIALSAGSQAYGGSWFGRLTEAEINMPMFGIEFAVVGVGWNKFAVVAPTS